MKHEISIENIRRRIEEIIGTQRSRNLVGGMYQLYLRETSCEAITGESEVTEESRFDEPNEPAGMVLRSMARKN